MDDSESGIFLFKSSKSRVSSETIFTEPIKPDQRTETSLSREFLNGKWLKRFLLKFTNPWLLTKETIVPVTAEQLLLESKQSYDKGNEPVLDVSVHNDSIRVRKATRGNRRHKTKSRKQRILKMKKKQTNTQ